MKLFGSVIRAASVRTSARPFALRNLSSAAPAIVDVVGGRNLDGLDITPRCAQVHTIQQALEICCGASILKAYLICSKVSIEYFPKR